MSSEKRFITSRGIIVTGWVALLLVGISIILANVYLWVTGSMVPSALENWGSMVLGFLFGTFISLIKEFIQDETDNTHPN